MIITIPVIIIFPSVLLAFPTASDTTKFRGLNTQLIPNEQGELVHATPSQRAARSVNTTLIKRDDCSDKKYHGPADVSRACYQFCERSANTKLGDALQVSADIDCDTTTCDVAHAESVTITESFSITLGGNSAPGAEGNAILAGSASFSWSRSDSTTDTYTFHPKQGDVGHIVFKPWYHQSCGDFQSWNQWSSDDGFEVVCEDPIVEDPNACGQSPMKLEDGKADGEADRAGEAFVV
ncbi:hypothetical protein K491DRAFT_710692 [Lophiostoma macrostomum CBS 122681]|uniref:Uncharacterized protein n=1 Tax=Lophiostoma macrostomum CBS 122681 TaxID=1314788 RepID=A0A6A6TQL3_9PLEO|nr:hypothetical protein K491DRAFT_710692 [Lophiostoma macrostomum CBS 122681]